MPVLGLLVLLASLAAPVSAAGIFTNKAELQGALERGPTHRGRADNASLRVRPDVAHADAVRDRTSCCESASAVAELASRALAMPTPLPVGSAAVVVAQCTSDVAWLPDAVDALRRANATSVSVYLYSKCAGKRQIDAKGLEAALGARAASLALRTLPNRGRNDHTFATHIATHYDSLPTTTLFIKDTFVGHHRKDMQRFSLDFDQFIAALRREAFACRRSPDVQGVSLTHSSAIIRRERGEGRFRQKWVPTRWASRDALFNFTLRKYRYKETLHDDAPFQPYDGRAKPRRFLTLGRWLTQLGLHSLGKHGATLAAGTELLPVCYGGEFGATVENIRRVARADWRILAAALDRGDNIIEGHLMERAWAALVGPRFPPRLVRRMLCRCGRDDKSRREIESEMPYAGLLIDPYGPGLTRI